MPTSPAKYSKINFGGRLKCIFFGERKGIAKKIVCVVDGAIYVAKEINCACKTVLSWIITQSRKRQEIVLAGVPDFCRNADDARNDFSVDI